MSNMFKVDSGACGHDDGYAAKAGHFLGRWLGGRSNPTAYLNSSPQKETKKRFGIFIFQYSDPCLIQFFEQYWTEHQAKPSVKPCQFHKASFAPSISGFLVIECLGPGIPTSAIYRVSNAFAEKPLTLIFHVQNNTRLKERVAMVALPQVRTFPVMISGGYHAQVRLFLPPGLREDEITRYPLILHV